jgi:hypothetical protein
MFGLTIAAHILLAAQTAGAPATNGRVIVRLVSQHEQISVLAAAGGVRYSATDAQGKMLVSNASLDELREQHPELYRHIAPTISASAADAISIIDAR